MILNLDEDLVLTTCESTQPLCIRRAEMGAAEGTVVWSWEQKHGRGRGGNQWSSPPSTGLWLSFLLRPSRPIEEWPILTALISMAAAQALEDFVSSGMPTSPASRVDVDAHRPFHVAIKWPNDLIVDRRKIGGVLAQTAGGGVVVGLGLNVWQSSRDFPTELQAAATSLWISTGPNPAAEVCDHRTTPGAGVTTDAVATPGPGVTLRDHSATPIDLTLPSLEARRAEIVRLAGLLNHRLTAAYSRFQNGDSGFIQDELRKRFFLRGADVVVQDGLVRYEGRAVDLSSRCELVIETDRGKEIVRSGTVVTYHWPEHRADAVPSMPE